MNTISIGAAQRPLRDADAAWIRHQFEQQMRAGHLPCVRITLDTADVRATLQTPNCGGGAGGRPPNAREQKVFDLWNMEGLNRMPFSAQQVADFVERVKRILP